MAENNIIKEHYFNQLYTYKYQIRLNPLTTKEAYWKVDAPLIDRSWNAKNDHFTPDFNMNKKKCITKSYKKIIHIIWPITRK